MRELNPRAWSIEGECWCSRVDYDGYKKEWSGVAPVLAPDNRSKRIGEIVDTNIIVEFPTGIKDKNGKEICEGDIVKVEDDEYTNDHDKFLGYNATVIRSILKPGAFVVKNWWGERLLQWDVKLRRVEVIGNIHENPELLDVKKEG